MLHDILITTQGKIDAEAEINELYHRNGRLIFNENFSPKQPAGIIVETKIKFTKKASSEFSQLKAIK